MRIARSANACYRASGPFVSAVEVQVLKGGFSDPPFLCPGPVMTAGQEDTDIWLCGTQKRSQRTSSACSAPPCPRSTSSMSRSLPGGVLRVLIDHPDGVDHERCVEVGRALVAFRERFALEVSSPVSRAR